MKSAANAAGQSPNHHRSTSNRTSAWVVVAMVLLCAFGLRQLGIQATENMSEPRGMLSHLVFAGVALLAAGLAGLVGRIWATPSATVLLGVLGGLLATRYEDSVPGALLGLGVGALMATSVAWQATRWATRTLASGGAFIGLGVATGAGMGASWQVDGWLGPVRAGGVAFASFLVYQAFRTPVAKPPAISVDASPSVPVRHRTFARTRKQLAFAAGWMAGAWWLAEPLFQLATRNS